MVEDKREELFDDDEMGGGLLYNNVDGNAAASVYAGFFDEDESCGESAGEECLE